MDVCVYAWMDGWMDGCSPVCMYVGMYACMHITLDCKDMTAEVYFCSHVFTRCSFVCISMSMYLQTYLFMCILICCSFMSVSCFCVVPGFDPSQVAGWTLFTADAGLRGVPVLRVLLGLIGFCCGFWPYTLSRCPSGARGKFCAAVRCL